MSAKTKELKETVVAATAPATTDETRFGAIVFPTDALGKTKDLRYTLSTLATVTNADDEALVVATLELGVSWIKNRAAQNRADRERTAEINARRNEDNAKRVDAQTKKDAGDKLKVARAEVRRLNKIVG